MWRWRRRCGSRIGMLIFAAVILTLLLTIMNQKRIPRELDKELDKDFYVESVADLDDETSEMDDDTRRKLYDDEPDVELGRSDGIEGENFMPPLVEDNEEEVAIKQGTSSTDFGGRGLDENDQHDEVPSELDDKPGEVNDMAHERADDLLLETHLAEKYNEEDLNGGEHVMSKVKDSNLMKDTAFFDSKINGTGEDKANLTHIETNNDYEKHIINKKKTNVNESVGNTTKSNNVEENREVLEEGYQMADNASTVLEKESIDDPIALDPGVANYDIKPDAEKVTVPLTADQDPPVMVIIMAQWRFGSSVIGEIFNQNPALLYLYEPLWVVDEMVRLWRVPGKFSRETYYYSTKLLQDFSRCDFSDKYMDAVNMTNAWGGRFRNSAICKETKGSCFIPSADWFREVCTKFKGHLATKIIRGDLGIIKPLVFSNDVNVKVIHLVRDPRGATSSRIKYILDIDHNELANQTYAKTGRLEPLNMLNYESRHSDSVEGMCQWLRDNVQLPGFMPDWLRDRYYLLRYEDFADNPTKVTADLYKFAGLQLPDSVNDWVVRNTRAATIGGETFDVAKNSSATSGRWLEDLSEVEIKQVETICLDVMKTLGYEPYNDLIQVRPTRRPYIE